MKKTIATILILMAVATIQAQTEISLGKDSKGLEWFTFKDKVTKIGKTVYFTGIHTEPKRKGETLIVYMEVDCSDDTVRLVGLTIYDNGKKVATSDEVGGWGKPKGIARKVYNRICTPSSSIM